MLNEAKWCGNYTGMFTAVVTALDQLEVSVSDVEHIFWRTAHKLYNVTLD